MYGCVKRASEPEAAPKKGCGIRDLKPLLASQIGSSTPFVLCGFRASVLEPGSGFRQQDFGNKRFRREGVVVAYCEGLLWTSGRRHKMGGASLGPSGTIHAKQCPQGTFCCIETLPWYTIPQHTASVQRLHTTYS